MRYLPAVLAVLSVTALPFVKATAQADPTDADLSYTFLEVDYANLDVDVVDDDQNVLEDLDDGGGFQIRGSLAFTPNFFGFADYSVTDSDATFVDESEVLLSSSQDAKRLNVGLGINFGINPPVIGDSDFVFRAAYSDIDFDDFDFGGTNDSSVDDLNNDSSDGYFVDALVRSQLVTWAEAGLGVRYTDIEEADELSVIGNLLLELNQNWGLNLEFDASDDVGFYLVGLRYSFDHF